MILQFRVKCMNLESIICWFHNKGVATETALLSIFISPSWNNEITVSLQL